MTGSVVIVGSLCSDLMNFDL